MILCAAIRVNKDIVIGGYRHGDCYETLYKLNPQLSAAARSEGTIEEGFLDKSGEFRDRHEAWLDVQLYHQIGQTAMLEKMNHGENLLYSEDIY